MPTVYALTAPKQQWATANGAPASGYKLFIYLANTSTKATTYQDAAALAANSNPIILNTLGQVPAGVFVATGVYDLLLGTPTDTDPPSATVWSAFDITPTNDVGTINLDQWIAAAAPTYISASSFSVVGDQTLVFHVGRRTKAAVTGGTGFSYGTIVTSVYDVPTNKTTVTLLNSFGTLDSGLSAVWYGILTVTDTAMPVRLDSLVAIINASDRSKGVRFDVSGVAAGNTRVISFPNFDTRIWNLPAGGVMEFAGTVAPTGYLLCDGTSYPTSSFAGLFAVIGYAFGGAGANFNVPDIRGRTVVGVGTGAGLTPRALAATFGEEGHVQVAGELVGHSHNVSGAGGVGDASTTLLGLFQTFVKLVATTVTGVNPPAAMNVMQPSIALNYIIAY